MTQTNVVALTAPLDDDRLIAVLQNSLYPGAAPESVRMVLGYCRASGLDPMLKPVHIVPMWDSKLGALRDVVMPGIGLYRTQASRTGECAGMSEPEFGPETTETIGGVEITFPAWCKVTSKRLLRDGTIAEFPAIEFWKENYAMRGGKEKSIAPNAMWRKRPFGQLAKCAKAQALREAFPELGAAPTADEMEGKPLDPADTFDVSATEKADPWTAELRAAGNEQAKLGVEAYGAWWKACPMEFRMAAKDSQLHADYKDIAIKADAGKPPVTAEGKGNDPAE